MFYGFPNFSFPGLKCYVIYSGLDMAKVSLYVYGPSQHLELQEL